jgi:uncharacterized membrane protein YdjX (TVP38/TMEM64 family)
VVGRGGWLVFLVRVFALTSSDVVSFAAGLAGLPALKVAAGSLAGMAPLCYAQAYLAERLFTMLPGSLWIVAGLGAAYVVVVIWVVLRAGRRPGG